MKKILKLAAVIACVGCMEAKNHQNEVMDFQIKHRSCYSAQIGYGILAANMNKVIEQSLTFFNRDEARQNIKLDDSLSLDLKLTLSYPNRRPIKNLKLRPNPDQSVTLSAPVAGTSKDVRF